MGTSPRQRRGSGAVGCEVDVVDHVSIGNDGREIDGPVCGGRRGRLSRSICAVGAKIARLFLSVVCRPVAGGRSDADYLSQASSGAGLILSRAAAQTVAVH